MKNLNSLLHLPKNQRNLKKIKKINQTNKNQKKKKSIEILLNLEKENNNSPKRKTLERTKRNKENIQVIYLMKKMIVRMIMIEKEVIEKMNMEMIKKGQIKGMRNHQGDLRAHTNLLAEIGIKIDEKSLIGKDKGIEKIEEKKGKKIMTEKDQEEMEIDTEMIKEIKMIEEIEIGIEKIEKIRREDEMRGIMRILQIRFFSMK